MVSLLMWIWLFVYLFLGMLKEAEDEIVRKVKVSVGEFTESYESFAWNIFWVILKRVALIV